jgi:competence protein ComEA
LIQAVRAAGGPTSNADIDAVNLAEKLSDGEKIYIPTKAEMKAQQPIVAAAPQNFIGRSSVVPTGPGASQSASEGAGAASRKASKSKSGGRGGNKLTDPSQGTVDINTADDAELQRLPGVGPAMAQRIIAFRATTHFSKPEDLMQVSGVGQKKFAKMQPFVSI